MVADLSAEIFLDKPAMVSRFMDKQVKYTCKTHADMYKTDYTVRLAAIKTSIMQSNPAFLDYVYSLFPNQDLANLNLAKLSPYHFQCFINSSFIEFHGILICDASSGWKILTTGGFMENG